MIENYLNKLVKQGNKKREIANRIGMSEAYVGRLAKGMNCSIETLIKLADAYGVTTDEILGRTIKKHDDM